MSSIVVKVLTISPYFWIITESQYSWYYRVGSPGEVITRKGLKKK